MSTSDDETSVILEWRVHPAEERPVVTSLAALVMSLLAGLAAWLMQHWVWFFIAAAILLVNLRQYFFVSDHQITAEKISVRNPWMWRSLRWHEIRRFQYNARGGLLSRRAKPSMLDTVSGLQILFGENRDDIISTIQAHLKPTELPTKDTDTCGNG